MRTWGAAESTSEYTATVSMPRVAAVASTRTAISPRLATSNGPRQAQSVTAGSRRTAHRSGVEPVAWVVHLRAIGDQCQDLDFGLESQRPSRGRDPVDDAQRAVLFDGHVHVPVDVADEVPFAEPPTGTFGQEVLHAGMLGLGVVAIPQRVGLLRAGSTQGVVAPDVVGHHGEQRPAQVRAQLAARREEDGALPRHRVRGAVPFGGVRGHVEKAVDRLVAVQIDDLARTAHRDDPGPGRASSHAFVTLKARHEPPRASRSSTVFRYARWRSGLDDQRGHPGRSASRARP